LRSASQPTFAIPIPRHPRPVVVAGPADIEALIQQLQRPDTVPPDLPLHLLAHTDAEALARLLAVVDELVRQGTLTALRVTVEGSGQGPIAEPLREALAGSRACLVLSGATVRPLLFGDPASVHGLQAEGLLEFLDMRLGNRMDSFLEVQVADKLARFALRTGEDTLLRAVAVLSPYYQHRFEGLPDQQVYERLVRQGVAYSLDVQLDRTSAPSLTHWLNLPRPTLRAIELHVVESLDADSSMPLWAGLMNQGSIQRVKVDIACGVTIDWAPDRVSSQAPAVRLHTLWIRLADRIDSPPPIVTGLMSGFQPMNVVLRTFWVSTASPMVEAIPDPVHQQPLESLCLTCEMCFGANNLELMHTLMEFLRRFDRVRQVCVRVQHVLPALPVLRALDASAAYSLQLRSLKLIGPRPPHWDSETHTFDRPLRLRLNRGRFLYTYVVALTKEFFQRQVGVTDPFTDMVQQLDDEDPLILEQGLRASGFLTLAQVSSEAHNATVKKRREHQALVLVNAMCDGLLDPLTLRELLMGPSGQLNSSLVVAVFKHLRDASEDKAVWRLFDAATAFH
jgi:hypothetical protein